MKNFLKNLEVLYIEDNSDISDKTLFELNDYFQNIVISSNISDAFFLIKNKKIDLIITEINFKIDNGIEFLKEIRNFDYWLPIIIITDLIDSSSFLACINSNIQGYIKKPFNKKDFEVSLKNVFKYKNQISVDKIMLKEYIYYDIVNYTIENFDEIFSLNKKERLLLDLLLENKNKVVSYKNIETVIWYYEDKVMTQEALKTVIKSLRKKTNKNLIKNISGLGYKIIIN